MLFILLESNIIIHKISYYFACQTLFVMRLMDSREANIFLSKNVKRSLIRNESSSTRNW